MTAIELANICFHYSDRPSDPVLKIPKWSVKTGEQVFVCGPSGGGKSTLLGLISGLLQPTQGQLTVLDQRLDLMPSRQRDRFRAAYIGYVFQQFNLIPYLSAMDNVLLATRFSSPKGTSFIKNEIKTLFSTLNIDETLWHSETSQLSVGQQQRVAIARALINRPRLLIADEPTSSLDEANRDAFMALLMSMVADNQMTLIFVSHDMSISSYFNRTDQLNAFNQLEGAE